MTLSTRSLRNLGALAAALAVLAGLGWGQLLEFCELTDVQVEPLPNGVRIRLKADGVIKTSWDYGPYWHQDEDGNWRRTQTRRFTFLLRNVRGAPAPMISVGRHPVSHLEFEVPPGARESIGLLCSVVLYRSGVFGMWRSQSDDEARGRADDIPYEDGPIRVDMEPTRDRSQLLIFVTSDRPGEPEPQRQDKILAKERLHVTERDGLLTVDAVNADLHELVRQASALSAVTVYVDDYVQRRASVHLMDVTFDELLEALANGYGLSLSKPRPVRGGDGPVRAVEAYYLSSGVPDTASAYWASSAQSIPLHHITAESAFQSLPDCLLTYVHSDPGTNTLIVTGPQRLIDKVARDVAELDKPLWYANLRGWVLEIATSEDERHEASISLSGGTTYGRLGSEGTISVEVTDRQPREILAGLRDLRRRGLVKVKAFPSISVLNGETGQLFVGEQQYFWRLVGYEQEVALTSVSAGTRLSCQPFTSGDVININALIESDSIIGGGTEPAVSRRRVRTSLCLRSGQTVVAGGVILGETSRETRRPWPHGDWATFGSLLRGRTSSDVAREVWVLVQPRAREGAPPDEPSLHHLESGDLGLG